jgi:hypothetical protein
LKKSMTNIASECRSANIVRDHAMILPDVATPEPDEIFGKDNPESQPGDTAIFDWRRHTSKAGRPRRLEIDHRLSRHQ